MFKFPLGYSTVMTQSIAEVAEIEIRMEPHFVEARGKVA
jgi:hypothetical protein